MIGPSRATEPPASVDAVSVGAGMSGLAAADHLAARGRSVLVVEAGPAVGGLARAITVGGEPIEPYYHHVFPQDRATLALVDRMGMTPRMEWRRASMGILHGGTVLAFDGVLDILRFSPLPPVDRVRLGLATAAQLVRRDASHLDRATVAAEGPRWFGRRAYDAIWRPLLEAKFGPDADRVAMAWLVARIRQRAGARRATGDRLGYLRGSLGTLATAYAESLGSRGVTIRVGTRVASIARDGADLEVRLDGDGSPDPIRARSVVACVSGPVLARMTELPGPYARAISAIPYRGVSCVLVELDRPLGARYWISVTDRLGLGCLGIIEHTNLVPADRYGGRHLLYLAHYVGSTDPAWTASPDELIRAAGPALRAVNPGFTEDWVVGAHIARDAYAQPVPLVGGPMPHFPVATGVAGIFHASLAHVYPDDRGVSMALRVGARAAIAAEDHLAAGAP